MNNLKQEITKNFKFKSGKLKRNPQLASYECKTARIKYGKWKVANGQQALNHENRR